MYSLAGGLSQSEKLVELRGESFPLLIGCVAGVVWILVYVTVFPLYAVLGVFLKAGLVDELVVYMAPSILGSDARGWFDDLALNTLGQRIKLVFKDVRMIGADLRIVAMPVQ